MCISELCVATFLFLYYKLFTIFCEQTMYNFFIFTVLYFVTSELLIQMDLLNSISWRNSQLVRFLNKIYANAEFDQKSCAPVFETLNNINNKNRLIIFAVDPHGVATLGMSLLFAGNGSNKFRNIECLKNGRVVAHWAHKLIPFVREIFAIFGVIGSLPFTVKRFLKTHPNKTIVLCPSGIQGKVLCSTLPDSENMVLVHETNQNFNSSYGSIWPASNQMASQLRSESQKEKINLPIFKRKRKGFIKMALENNALLVPTLSIHEQFIYKRHTRLPSFHMISWIKYPFPLWIRGAYGSFLGHFIPSNVSEDNTMAVVMHDPIDCSKFTNIDELYNHFYDCLENLAKKHNCQINYYTCL